MDLPLFVDKPPQLSVRALRTDLSDSSLTPKENTSSVDVVHIYCILDGSWMTH